MTSKLKLKDVQKEWHGSFKSYVIGSISSFLLTGISFYLVAAHALSKGSLIYAIAGLALIQAIIQLRFFLHLGEEPSPKWESVMFYFMMLVLLIIVAGSLWIMHDLDTRVMEGM